ncbi:heterokaryon incompatibility protein-domain-containing protein [Immersiella caudata]|uniref:Heterokaryon incompatibility protein-domain-containing protein n=1 Tax=Immersiella caudata TaxID=314043 RepID=A0AA39WZ45_9PEZI|nr:heterokaryon incompatibility protein-domain-containing protein [Immersiella caudata]
MRLINSHTLELKTFLGQDIPPYAILSHTWDTDEFSLQDFQNGRNRDTKAFQKIFESCRLARDLGLHHVWIDTCCIDKTSSAELSEAINSMFQWYQNAEICFAHLSDLPLASQPSSRGKPPDVETQAELPRCRWFARGWTLQELIAPTTVHFLDSAWNFRGTKAELVNNLAEITGVRLSVLQANDDLYLVPAAEKMAWASRRSTSRIEDMAYCLMGIFDVNMPLLYGEGPKAFRRLQEEVLRKTNDLSLLAWEAADPTLEEMRGAWAKSPREFEWLASERLKISVTSQYNTDLQISSKGLRISTQLCGIYDSFLDDESAQPDGVPFLRAPPRHIDVLDLGCCSHAPMGDEARTFRLGIRVRKFGPSLYIREIQLGAQGEQLVQIYRDPNDLDAGVQYGHDPQTVWLQTEDRYYPTWVARRPTLHVPKEFYREFNNYVLRPHSQWRDIHFPWHPQFSHRPTPVHGEVWNCSNQTVMTGWVAPRMWEAVRIWVTLKQELSHDPLVYELLVICCDLHADPWVLLLEASDVLAQEFLHSKRDRLRPVDEKDMLQRFSQRVFHIWEDRELDCLRVTTADGRWRIQARRVNQIVQYISPSREVSSLFFEFQGLGRES